MKPIDVVAGRAACHFQPRIRLLLRLGLICLVACFTWPDCYLVMVMVLVLVVVMVVRVDEQTNRRKNV